MTAAFWLATGQTVVFLALCGWAWWITGRVAHLLNAADIIQQHSEAGAQHATRAALDARAMLDVLTEHWQRMRDQQAETQPHPIVGPDTVPAQDAITPEAIAAESDPWVKQQMTEIMANLSPAPKPEPAKKASPRPRKRTAS